MLFIEKQFLWKRYNTSLALSTYCLAMGAHVGIPKTIIVVIVPSLSQLNLAFDSIPEKYTCFPFKNLNLGADLY